MERARIQRTGLLEHRAFEQPEIAHEKREPWIMALSVGPGYESL